MEHALGQTALVTGSANGIGWAAASRLHQRGCRVVLADIDLDAAHRRASELDPDGHTAHGLWVDIADSDAVAAMIDDSVERFGSLDVLVNNAGLPGRHATAEMTDTDWERLLNLNLTGAFATCRSAYAALSSSDSPTVVNVSSLFGLLGVKQRAGYAAAKAGLIGLTRVMAAEWADIGIRVNAVAPGYVRTAGFEQRMNTPEHDVTSAIASQIPLKRMADPNEIANAISFLASDEASYITGQVLAVDGGISAVHSLEI